MLSDGKLKVKQEITKYEIQYNDRKLRRLFTAQVEIQKLEGQNSQGIDQFGTSF